MAASTSNANEDGIPTANTKPAAAPSPWHGVVQNYETGEEQHGQSIKFSPFDANRLAISTGGDYGLNGPGRVFVLDRDPSSGKWKDMLVADYRDNLLDICWSESDSNVLTTAAGDGFVQVWNLSARFPKVPVHEFKGHKLEMSSVEWSPSKFGNILLAACWDGQYDMTGPWPLLKMVASEVIVYQAAWSPHSQYTFACVSQEGVLQVWDMQANNQKAQIYLPVSESELLSLDWNKYSTHVVATASSDCTVKGWDLRNYSQPLFTIMDHGHAVRRVKFSPYHPTVFASVSYDMSLRIFDYHISDENLEIIADHTEFIYGLDWNLNYRNEIATCAFDRTVKVCSPRSLVGT